VRDNIKLFNPNITDPEILNIFRGIGAAGLVKSADFLDINISNRSGHSDSIKNIINIVRSVAKPAQFYIFNRCFAHMNSDIIERVIKKLKSEGKNCLFVTFNATVCKSVDEVCFTRARGAQVIAPHNELLSADKEYASFFMETSNWDNKYKKPTAPRKDTNEQISNELSVEMALAEREGSEDEEVML
jgi:ABC-type transport system involved in cytochrome bd biosynthesis fused ATPase/permease subunit